MHSNIDLQSCTHFNQITHNLYEVQGNSNFKYNQYVISVALRAPSNVKHELVKSTSIEITWDRSDGATGYYISYTTTALRGGKKHEPVDAGNTTKYTLTNLVENTPYDITVQGYARYGRRSVKSAVVTIKTGKWCITKIISCIYT